MTEPVVLLDWPAPYVARLRINRPDKRNAIDVAVRQGLIDHLMQLQNEASFRALVLGGVGGTFSAGGDVPSMAGLDADGASERMQHAHVLCRLVAGLRVPVVSAFEGVSTGAAIGLALLGDEIIMGRSAKVLFPFLRLGLAPDWGQLLTLPRRVGLPAARRLFTRDGPVLATEAEQLGLADLVCDDDAVMAVAIERASALASLPALAYGQMKQRLNHPSATLAEELGREEADQVACLCSPDFLEGYRAFREKRSPVFLPTSATKT
ncbi:MAG: enoyl-CoA hydratase/isomerase family protein [Pigmentiphaga sp.]